MGQRKGLGLGGIKGFKNSPWYVINKNVKENFLVVAQGIKNLGLMSIGLIADQIHWINDIQLKVPFNCTVKTRYQHIDVVCQVTYYTKNEIKVLFLRPESSITPGQSVVFYFLNLCLGGAIIKERLPYVKL